jgi:hypothetical protein
MFVLNEEIRERFERNRGVCEQFVVPIYRSLLNANFTRPPRDADLGGRTEQERDAICAQIVTAAKAISDEQIAALLSGPGWRERLVAGWLAGLSKRRSFVETIGGLLHASQQTYAGQGYCVALGLIGDSECRGYLREYLSKYLPLNGRFYDQHWAIGALTHLEGSAPEELLAPELWTSGSRSIDPLAWIESFAGLVELLDKHDMRVVL